MILPSPTPFSPDTELTGPQDLPEPFRSSFYSVIQHCNLTQPEASYIIVWGSGQEAKHPGSNALSDQDMALVLQWIRSGGGR